MLVRAFDPADIDACVRILNVAGRVVEAGWPAVDRAEFRRVTQAEEILVAERQDALAGFLSFYRQDRFIHHLYVAPGQWRQGVGRALLAAALGRLGGCAKLKCRQDDAAALAFYRHLGWAGHPGGTDDRGAWLWLHSPKENGR